MTVRDVSLSICSTQPTQNIGIGPVGKFSTWWQCLSLKRHDVKGSSMFPKTFLPRLLPQHSATLAFSNRVDFFKLLFDFCQTHGLIKESRLSLGVSAPALGSGEGLKEKVQDFRHPWRSGMGLASLEGWWSWSTLMGFKISRDWMW